MNLLNYPMITLLIFFVVLYFCIKTFGLRCLWIREARKMLLALQPSTKEMHQPYAYYLFIIQSVCIIQIIFRINHIIYIISNVTYYGMLYHVILYHIILYYIILYYIILYYIILYYIILYYIILYYIILYYIILYYIILYYFISFLNVNTTFYRLNTYLQKCQI